MAPYITPLGYYGYYIVPAGNGTTPPELDYPYENFTSEGPEMKLVETIEQ